MYYPIESRYLFTIKGQDKLLSVNETIRTAIHKSGGDFVKVSLYLLETNKKMHEDQLAELFAAAGLSKKIAQLSGKDRTEIFENLGRQESEDAQIQVLSDYIEKLGGKVSF